MGGEVTFAYHVAHENPLKVILGLAGLTIDSVISDEQSRVWLRHTWKYHKQIERMILKKEEKMQILEDYIFIQNYRKGMNQTRDFRKNGNSFPFFLARLRNFFYGR